MPGRQPGIWQHSRQRRRARHLAAQQTKKAAGLQLWSGRARHLATSIPGKRPGHWTAEQAKEAGEASPGIVRRRRGIAGGNAGQGVPGRAFPAPQAPGDDASQAPTPDATRLPFQRLPCSLCARLAGPSVLSVFLPWRPTPDATRLPFQRLPCSLCFCLGAPLPRPGRKKLAEFQFSLEAMGLQREADTELPSAPLEAVGVGRGIGGIEFPVILPLFD